MPEQRGVLVMAYGTPRSLDDVEEYYTDIRHGRPPSPDQLQELVDRYRAIGGSPLLEITQEQARGIGERLGLTTYLGQKHAAPFIPDAIASIASEGVQRLAAIVLAPHYSKMSIGDYEARVLRAAESVGFEGSIEIVQSWHLEPGYIGLLAERVHDALSSLSKNARADAIVIFTAHSLPVRILQSGDPYPDQLQETAAAVAERSDLSRWMIGWQSAGRTKDAWLGPDITEILPKLATEGCTGVVVCPCGFVSDHLEVLYDIDIEAKDVAVAEGIEITRTAMPNADPRFLDVLAGVVARAFAAK
jgi:protoporphyrin/coproporphyrin ferrochelatase